MDDFPEDVRQFLIHHIGSVDQLEVLLLLKGSPQREWDAASVAQALYTQERAAATRLDELRKLGLVAGLEGTPARYVYAPTPELDRLVGRLADVYAKRRVTVIGIIYSKPSDQVQAFADAFRIRRDK